MLAGCGGGGSDTPGATNIAVTGAAQKGPFLGQGRVIFFELDAQGNRSGRRFTTATLPQGNYTGGISWSGPTEIEARGLYYNELTAAPSTSERSLSAITIINSNTNVNLNLFTDLVYARVKQLLVNGQTVAPAIDQATAELQSLFHLQLAGAATAGQLDLVDGNGGAAADNANMLLFSAAVLSAFADDSAYTQLRDDFADDGLFNGAAMGHWLRIQVMATSVDLNLVALNIQNLAWVTDAPDLADLNNTLPAWVFSGGDYDADGVSDRDEILFALTDPMISDTDQDGLDDGQEINVHGTDPLSGDSDNDTLPDAWEVAFGLDPLFDDTAGDADSDGLSNLAEYQNLTDPQQADSDGDGYNDGQELAAGGNPLDAASVPLAIVSTPPLSVEATRNYSYPAATTWTPVSYALSAQPAGMTVNSSSGVINWTPGMVDSGVHAVTLDATANGYTVSQSFNISVAAFNTGDINEDGFVDARDALLAKRIALGLMTASTDEFNRADVKLDGAVSAADALLIEQMAFGL